MLTPGEDPKHLKVLFWRENDRKLPPHATTFAPVTIFMGTVNSSVGVGAVATKKSACVCIAVKMQ